MKNPSHTLGELLDCMSRNFQEHAMEQAHAEAVAIIAELLDCNRVQAEFDRARVLTQKVFERGLDIMQRRLRNEPWQYIFERAYFRDLTLRVTPDVLIPRPETELLAEWCILFTPQHGSLLDVGTGSGAIALSVAGERCDVKVTACDVSKAALQIAQSNQQPDAVNKVEFLESDLLSSFSGRKFDVIAANLPYVTETEHAELSPEVRDFEPKLALTADNDGLALICKLIEQAPQFLNNRGAIILEMSDWQTSLAADYLSDQLCWSAIEIKRDYTQRNRFVVARLREQLIF